MYDQDFNLVDYGFDQVSEAARIPEDTAALSSHAFEELSLEIPVSQPGFLYLYVSNENQENVTAYFDDLAVDYRLSPVTYAADYYPFGFRLSGRQHDRARYGRGYQGEWSLDEEETRGKCSSNCGCTLLS